VIGGYSGALCPLFLLVTNQFRHPLHGGVEPIVLALLKIVPDAVAVIAEAEVYGGKVTDP
jgi:hypothetical protein